jgi:hypothetical protein
VWSGDFLGSGVHLRGVLHQEAGPAELLDQGNLFGAGGAGHHGDERQPEKLGEVGLRDGRSAAGGLHDGGVFPDPAVDQAEQEQRARQAVLQAAGTVCGFVFQVQLDAPVFRQRNSVEVRVR